MPIAFFAPLYYTVNVVSCFPDVGRRLLSVSGKTANFLPCGFAFSEEFDYNANGIYSFRSIDMLDSGTEFIYLIGTPLGQSYAARMQNRAYEVMGLNMCYAYCETGSEHLGEIVSGLRWMPNIAGFAVTKPNKEKVLPYLDELDPLCRKMGACNTVLRKEDGTLVGYNTDGAGFITSLREEAELDVRGKRFFCIGSGGAGRAICFELAENGAEKIYIAARHRENAERLSEELNTGFAPIAESVPHGDFSRVKDCDAVINASGVGMVREGESPMPKEFMLPGRLYFDAAYNPFKTRFLMDAEDKGCRILNGLGMSLYQGAAQIKIWTGRDAPLDAMRRELMDILAGK